MQIIIDDREPDSIINELKKNIRCGCGKMTDTENKECQCDNCKRERKLKTIKYSCTICKKDIDRENILRIKPTKIYIEVGMNYDDDVNGYILCFECLFKFSKYKIDGVKILVCTK